MKTVRKKHTRFLTALICGIIAAVIGGYFLGLTGTVLVGWDVGALVLLLQILVDFHGHGPHETKRIASRDDMNNSLTDILVISASLVSIGAVAILLTSSHVSLIQICFGLISIIISWATVHGVFALRYAAQYFSGSEGGVDFNSKDLPTFGDFMYLSYTIGMTYQVSDTNFTSPRFRSMALRHALLSFVFGTAIIATTINVVASLIH